MTELASGAVSSLLAVVRNEALLLDGVQDDVLFIKEEMESMKSFLAHLARTTPPGGEHDEQVRTWMNQVRRLAQDCHNCIDLYLYSGNDPDIHRAKGGLRRYLWWAYWFLRKLLAQHHAAVQLRQLKDRARDVGDRRLRYGVEVPEKSKTGAGLAATASSSSSARGGFYEAAAGDDNEEEEEDCLFKKKEEEEDGDNQLVSTRATSSSRTLDDYVKAKLWEWEWGKGVTPYAGECLSMVTVAPYTYQDLLSLVQETLVSNPKGFCYQRIVLIDIPAVHFPYMPLRAEEILFYILQKLKQKQGQDLNPWEVYKRRVQIFSEKEEALALLKIEENIKEMNDKLEKIKSDIIHGRRIGNGDGLVLPKGDKLQRELDHLDLGVLLQLLFQEEEAIAAQDQGRKNGDMHILPAQIAKKLKEHMEAEEKNKVLQEEEVTKHMELEEGEEATGKNTEEDDMVEGEGEVTKRTDEAAAEEGGEIEGEGEVTTSTENEVAEEVGNIAEHTVEGEGGGEEIKSQHATRIHLDEAQYARILHSLFPKSSSSRPLHQQAQDRSLVGKRATKNATTSYGSRREENMTRVTEKIGQMIDNMKQEFEEQLKIKGLVEEIKKNLNDHRWKSNEKECTLFILKVDELMDVSTCTLEDTRNALSLLNNSSAIMIVTTRKEDIQVAKEYCYPPREPIDYSLAGLYYDTVLELFSKPCLARTGEVGVCFTRHVDTVLELIRQNNGDSCYQPQIFHDILDECEPHEWCMKIFIHALYANPKRSNEELLKLHSILQDLPASFNSIAKVMFEFSYNDLPKQYKSCFLYLAIFPPGHEIRRSTLIGRWVAEGLTSKEDWHSSVRQANRCFDALVDRCLVYPADIGAAGNVKSCVVGEPVHGIITTIARKQHMLETRLSHHLARHFSVFNDLHLRRSDGIDKFFQGLSRSSSQVSVLKVLDLEGCKCFGGKNQRYLMVICRKMLQLKYLSLRRTDITQLPREINNLRELEVLDIRQTKVPPQATASILLLKLKRLLAGDVGLNYPSSFGSAGGQIPHKIYKMENMEVLCNVKAQHSRDLQGIGNLYQLRKLGVVIDDNDSHLKKLLQTISDHVRLRSLSITTVPVATPTPREALGTITSKVKFPCLSATPSPASADESPADGNGNGNGNGNDTGSLLDHHPNSLQCLTIKGNTTTHKGSLLSLFINGNKNILAKVTLSGTLLSQDDLKALAKLPMLRCVRLQDIACTENMLTFKKKEFKCLKYLLVESSDLTNITFNKGSARELEKMVLSFTSIGSISGVRHLPKLQELELNNSFCGKLLSSFRNATHIAKLTLRGTELEKNALQILAEKLNIRSLVLLEKSFGEGQDKAITFKKDKFCWLNHLVNRSATRKIVFTSGSAPRLEKIVWYSSTSLSGIGELPRLKELEFKGDQAVPAKVIEDIDKHQNKPSLILSGPESQG